MIRLAWFIALIPALGLAAPQQRVLVVSFQSLAVEPDVMSRVDDALRAESSAVTMCGEDAECLSTLGQRADTLPTLQLRPLRRSHHRGRRWPADWRRVAVGSVDQPVSGKAFALFSFVSSSTVSPHPHLRLSHHAGRDKPPCRLARPVYTPGLE